MKKLLVIGAVVLPLITLLLLKQRRDGDVKFLLKSVMEHYSADKVSLFKFYKDGDSPVNMGLDYTHMQCIGEVASEGVILLCEQQQSTQLNVLAEYINILDKQGAYIQPDVREEKSPGLKAMGDAYGIKSTYSRFIYNKMGKPIGLIAMNFNHQYVNIEDFEYYNEKSTEIGEFMSK